MESARTSVGSRIKGTLGIVVLAICLAAAWTSAVSPSNASSASASAQDYRTWPLVLVHGFEAENSSNCYGKWGDLMTKYRKWGFTGPLLPIRYYTGDTVCTPSSKYPGMLNPRIGSDTRDTPIQTISRQWAWFVYANFSQQGIPVNVVAHSMGGLIVRYAIYAVQTQKPGFPPFLVVPGVTTFGTPHNGVQTGPFSLGCQLQHDAKQCHQFAKNSNFIEELRANARNPQAAFGTFWSVAGSLDDDLVSARSALDLVAPYKIYWGKAVNIEHGRYMHYRADDDPPFEIGARCRGASYGEDYDHMGPWGNCWWPLNWSFAIMFGPA